MCPITMHGDEWLHRYQMLLNERYNLDIETHECNVKCKFGGGEAKTAKLRDVLCCWWASAAKTAK